MTAVTWAMLQRFPLLVKHSRWGFCVCRSGVVLPVLGFQLCGTGSHIQLAHKSLLFKEKPLARNLEQQILQLNF